MCVSIGVKDVGNAELADGKHPPVGAAIAAELVVAGFDGFAVPVQIERLAHEQARQP